ncbi:MAG: terminase family protein [Actinomycetota bacterium]|nr:terminase family protein [Actinomycetota bacterium]
MADLAVLRGDLSAFADAVGLPLERWQADALRLEARTTVIVAPRQSGKSRSLAAVALWWAFRRREQRVLIVSAGEDAARRLLAEVRRTAMASPLLRGSVADEQAGLLTLTNGSEIRSVPASERQVRGWTVDLLLCDEAALVPDDLLLGAALPTTAARPDARIVLASSATTTSGTFYDFAARGQQGSEHVRTHRWALGDAWWISPSAVAAAREVMSPQRFAAEYEGVFASGTDAMFSRHTIDRATADLPLFALGELRGPARLLAGVDWGVTTDLSVLTAIARVPVPERVFAVVACRAWPAGAPLPDVIEEIATCPAHFAGLALEVNGVGAPCAQQLARRFRDRPASAGGGRRRGVCVVDDSPGVVRRPERPWWAEEQEQRPAREFTTAKAQVHTSAELTAATYSMLRLMLDRGQLVIPAAAEDLRRELLLLSVDLTQGGTERIEASRGHDDRSDSLMLAAGPYKRQGRWRSWLGDLAERAALPDPPLPEGLPTVRTGAGLEVPVGAYASVGGRDLTLPPGTPQPRASHPDAAQVRAAYERARHHPQEVA